MSPLPWFVAVARAEGLTLLALWLVAMPLKYAAGEPEPVAYVGWLHGVLVFTYVIALWSTARVERWSWGFTLTAFVVAMVPFGTFWLERRLEGAPAVAAV